LRNNRKKTFFTLKLIKIAPLKISKRMQEILRLGTNYIRKQLIQSLNHLEILLADGAKAENFKIVGKKCLGNIWRSP